MSYFCPLSIVKAFGYIQYYRFNWLFTWLVNSRQPSEAIGPFLWVFACGTVKLWTFYCTPSLGNIPCNRKCQCGFKTVVPIEYKGVGLENFRHLLFLTATLRFLRSQKLSVTSAKKLLLYACTPHSYTDFPRVVKTHFLSHYTNIRASHS